MVKLVIQIAGMAVVIYLARVYELGLLATIACLIAGAIVVHVLWNRLFGFPHAGVVDIREDDPMMLEAIEEARRTWPQFLELYPQFLDHAIVKFRVETSHGTENIWGSLLELTEEAAHVRVETPPIGKLESEGPDMSVPIDTIIDWQIVREDDTLIGGFTQQATFRIVERDHGEMPPHFAEQMARYR